MPLVRGVCYAVPRHPSRPTGLSKTLNLVLDDFGRLGRAWRETDEDATDRLTLIRDLVEGEFNNPVRIVTFNTAEGWCRDVNHRHCRRTAPPRC
jgi:hypothetical protein